MEAHSFSSLKDMMKTPSSSKNVFETPKNTKASPSPLALPSSPPSSPSLVASSETKMTKLPLPDVGRLTIVSGGRMFPPPITCLRTVKKGKPYAYFRFNTSDNNFVVENINIPQIEILRAFRKDGRLRLYFVPSDDECSNDDEEENVTVAVEEEEEDI